MAEPQSVIADKVVARFYSPETGGILRPRFLFERPMAFEARLEAMMDGAPSDSAYDERYARAVIDRAVAEEMLSALALLRGEPLELPTLAAFARDAIIDRVGGKVAFYAAALAENIDEEDLLLLFRRKMRAAYYLHRNVAHILHPTEEDIREVFRTQAHPFRGRKFDDVRVGLTRWLVLERLRAAEVTFAQSSRSRVTLVLTSSS